MAAKLGRPSLKIMQALCALSSDGPKLVTYEDIVVKAWELYPDDFGLRIYSTDTPTPATSMYRSTKSSNRAD